MRRAHWLALLLSCACSSESTTTPPTTTPPATPPPATSPPATSPSPTPDPVPTPGTPSAPEGSSATTAVHAPRAVDPERARGVARELRELRRLVHDGSLAEAAPRFVALARREPGNPRLHCEAGFVAQQAGDPESAEDELAAGLEIYERMGTVPSALRVPFAMCLYNRGLLAEEDGDGWLAADCYRRSLSLRPNATVERHLHVAEAMPDGDVPADDASGTVTRRPWVVEGSRSATIVRTDLPTDPDDFEQGCFDEEVVVVDPIAGTASYSLAGACEGTFSIFVDWAYAEAPVWVDAGAPYGLVATVESSHGGRGDDADGSGIVNGETRTLHVMAVVAGQWAHGTAVISESTETDCVNDPCDDPESTEDDEYELRAELTRAYSFGWAIQAGNLVLTEESRSGPIDVPPVGATPLSTLLTDR